MHFSAFVKNAVMCTTLTAVFHPEIWQGGGGGSMQQMNQEESNTLWICASAAIARGRGYAPPGNIGE